MLICDILQQTNIAGYPIEFFTPFKPGDRKRREFLGIEKRETDFIKKVIRSSTTPNGVFGIKLHGHQIPVLLEKIRAEGLIDPNKIPTIKEVFDARFKKLHYVWVLRKNKIGQAISLYKAFNSGVWFDFSYEPTMYRQSETPNKDFDYDFEKIKECLALVHKDDAIWEHFFRYNKIEPLVVYYEDFAADYVAGTKKILEYLGLPTDIPIPEPRTKKQGDKTSEEWEKRFREEFDYQEEY